MDERWKEVYKVLTPRRDGTGYHGSTVLFGPAKISYREGHIVKAKPFMANQGYFITAFKTFEDAYAFKCNSEQEVWRCFAKGIIKYDRLPRVLPAPTVMSEDIPRMIRKKCELCDALEGLKTGMFKLWPQGTIMVRRLKLIQQLHTGRKKRIVPATEQWVI